jgi:penicillin-binding protein 2
VPLFLDKHSPSAGVPELQRRFGWLLAVIALAFLLLIGRLWQLQVVRGEHYYQASTDNFVKEESIPAVRGLILDRKGRVVVENRPAYNVTITPRYFTKQSRENLIRILGLTDVEIARIDKMIAGARDGARYESVPVLEDIPRERHSLIEQRRDELPGVDVQDVPHRSFPHGTLAAHALGYLNQLSPAELVAWRKEGYKDGDYVGRFGIEKQQENYLRGKKGHELFVVDAKGRRKSDAEAAELIKGERHVEPAPGHNVVLTLDIELQRLAERALRNHPAGGAAVVDVETGRILALVSKPAFDPNVMTGHLTRAEQAQMEADPLRPFTDKTLQEHYYPGSTYKFVTAIAGLEAGLITPEDRIICKGWYDQGGRNSRCGKAHGSVSLYEALTQSCNVYFWSLAERVGMDRIAAVARDFGFGAPSGLGMNADLPGRVPWRGWYEQKPRDGFRIGYTLNTAIGQGDTEVTIMQMALAYAALANGGRLWVPQIIERIETPTGKIVMEYEPELRRRVQVSSATLDAVARGHFGAVNDARGTAYSARLGDVTVAGKTGTAQVRKLDKLTKAQRDGAWSPFGHHAWFAGYAPADDPKIAVVVLVEHGGKGGHVAAPVAMEIVRAWAETVAPAPRVATDPEPPKPVEEAPGQDGAGIPTRVAPRSLP